MNRLAGSIGLSFGLALLLTGGCTSVARDPEQPVASSAPKLRTSDELDATLADARVLLERAERALGAKEFDAARTLLAQAIERVIASSAAADSSAAAELLARLGYCARDCGDPRQVRRALERVRDYRERTLPDDHVDLQNARADLAVALRELGELAAARALFEKVVGVWERTLPDEHEALQKARQGLAATLANQGDYAGARVLQERALAILVRTHREGDPLLAAARQNLASMAAALGDFATARALFEATLVQWEASLPDDHPYTQAARQNLANVLHLLGDVRGARPLQEKALAVLERTLAEDHPLVAEARVNLALTLLALDQAQDQAHSDARDGARAARALLERALAVFEATLPDDHPRLQMVRENLASALHRLGELEPARELLEKVLAQVENTLPDDHERVVATRTNLANVLRSLGELASARELQERTLEAVQRTLPDGNASVQHLRVSLSWTLAALEDRGALASVLDDLARGTAESLAEAEIDSPRVAFERAQSTSGEVSTLLSLTEPGSALERRVFSCIETARALGAGRNLFSGELSPQESALMEQVRASRVDVQSLVREATHSATDRDALAAKIADRVRERDRIQGELRSRLAARRGRASAIDVEALARTLPERSAAVGFRSFTRVRIDPPHGNPIREAWLVAFVLTDQGALSRVDFGPLAAIEAMVERWRAAIGQPLAARGAPTETRVGTEDEALEAAQKLRVALVEPLVAATSSASTLFVCLDDALHLVPLDALPYAGGLLGERMTIHVETSFRQRLERTPRQHVEPALLAIGGVDYDAKPSSSAWGAAPLVAANVASTPVRTEFVRGSADASPWNYLTGTRAEVRSIAARFQSAFGAEPLLLAGTDASRESFAALAPLSAWIHVATHGWFAPESIRSAARAPSDARSWTPISLEESVDEFAPMTRCGLAFAGANRTDDDDAIGILTAEEIAGLDLSRCELAVLSACETNVGLRRAGQGIQSLQAALHAAGARAAITSLWKVDDDATRELFEDFYTRIWSAKEPQAQALWSAKQALRGRGRPTRDWAGWVLSGDPR